MTHGSLFSGIGGFDLAAEWMGWQNVFHCEWNTFGQRVLKHYWPKAISYNDITKTDFTIHRGSIDILTGGFPCQPYSLAGKRKGKDDDRHLWPEMLRAIREIQPRWVVGENVLGLVNWSDGLVFHEVQADLEAEGYEVQPFVLPAVSVNAPHRRDRVWFVAKNTSSDGCLFGESIKEGAEVWQQRDISAGDTERVRREEMAGLTADSECNGRRAGTKRKHNNIREWTICTDKSKDGDKVRSQFRDGGCNWVTSNTNGIGCNDRSDNWRERQVSHDEERSSKESESERGGRFGRTGEICGDGDAADTYIDRLQRSVFPGWDDKQGRNRPVESIKEHLYTHGKSRIQNAGWQNFPTVSPICDGNDGISYELDSITFSKWRQESIKAGGNAVVPQVVLQIFRTIEEYEKMYTQ